MSTPRPGYASHFGIDNIPFGVASSSSHPSPTCVSRFGDTVIFLVELGYVFQEVADLPPDTFAKASLNDFAALSNATHQAVRQRLQAAIRSELPNNATEHVSAVQMHLPVQVGDFTDFSCSLDHVLNASEAAMGTRAAPSSFFYQPVGYAGRCSSLDVSGSIVQRPLGQFWEGKRGQSEIVFGPSRKMDYELELGCIIGQPVPRKEPVLAREAEHHIFGYVLVNDWSARDIQVLEMDPLGPLNGKNAGTTVSPWIITRDALEAYKTTSPPRKHDVARHLTDSGHEALNIDLTVSISCGNSDDSTTTCRSNASWMYWTLAQCVAHQAIGGAGLRTGDLLATGTVSGQKETEHGCLFEFMKAGETPPRGYIEDGETVTLTGMCAEGVGFGECVATLVAAKDFEKL